MRRLGDDQRGVLMCFPSHGHWYWGCGWTWDGNGKTERILESLVRRGLVAKAIEPILAHGRGAMVYHPTPAGLAWIEAERAIRVAAREARAAQS